MSQGDTGSAYADLMRSESRTQKAVQKAIRAHEAASLAESARGKGPHAALVLRWLAREQPTHSPLQAALYRLADAAEPPPSPRRKITPEPEGTGRGPRPAMLGASRVPMKAATHEITLEPEGDQRG